MVEGINGKLNWFTAAVHQSETRGSVYYADPGHVNASLFGSGEHLCTAAFGGGKAEFIIVTAGQRELSAQRQVLLLQNGSGRQGIHIEACADLRTRQDMAKVARQSIGNVDGCTGNATQRHA